jgi:phosphatidylinositol alpha-1,6-mannosyltransferase
VKGVQVSGKEALQTLTSLTGIRTDTFYYDPRASKAINLWRAVRRRGRVDTLLVWHSGLLKLAPFIASSRRRLIVFLHGIEVWRNHDPLTSLLMRRTDLFLSNSDHTWKRFSALHPACAGISHRTVHLGLGESLGATAAPPNGPPFAVMIGRMRKDEDYKGHREMIQIWPAVLDSMPDAELRIVGEGDLRPSLERMVQELGLSHRVRFCGAIPDSQKEIMLRECRALLLPSANEGFGLVYLEAMRLGRSCLVSNLDAGAEVVKPPEAGIAVDLTDSRQVACALIKLMTLGAEWSQMSKRAQQRYDTSFTAAHFRERLKSAIFNE